jgi:hypothetical protein
VLFGVRLVGEGFRFRKRTSTACTKKGDREVTVGTEVNISTSVVYTHLSGAPLSGLYAHTSLLLIEHLHII